MPGLIFYYSNTIFVILQFCSHLQIMNLTNIPHLYNSQQNHALFFQICTCHEIPLWHTFSMDTLLSKHMCKLLSQNLCYNFFFSFRLFRFFRLALFRIVFLYPRLKSLKLYAVNFIWCLYQLRIYGLTYSKITRKI